MKIGVAKSAGCTLVYHMGKQHSTSFLKEHKVMQFAVTTLPHCGEIIKCLSSQIFKKEKLTAAHTVSSSCSSVCFAPEIPKYLETYRAVLVCLSCT